MVEAMVTHSHWSFGDPPGNQGMAIYEAKSIIYHFWEQVVVNFFWDSCKFLHVILSGVLQNDKALLFHIRLYTALYTRRMKQRRYKLRFPRHLYYKS